MNTRKARVDEGKAIRWEYDSPLSGSGYLTDIIETPMPEVLADQTCDPGPLVLNEDGTVSLSWLPPRDKTNEELQYIIPTSVFFDRLTQEQAIAIDMLANTPGKEEIRYLWLVLKTRRLGVFGPPDGKTADRAKSQLAYGLMAQLFSVDEANRLFAPPTPEELV
jgi:hypothetical protein